MDNLKFGILIMAICVVGCGGADGDSPPPGGEHSSAGDVDTPPHDPLARADAAGTSAADAVAADTTTPDDAQLADEDTGPAAVTELPPGLIGTPQGPPFKGAAAFSSVVDSAGQPISAAQLVGAPTVMWFFPLANTAG